jgi:hypothetical protein
MNNGSITAYVEPHPLGGAYVTSPPRAGRGRYAGGLLTDGPGTYVSGARRDAPGCYTRAERG